MGPIKFTFTYTARVYAYVVYSTFRKDHQEFFEGNYAMPISIEGTLNGPWKLVLICRTIEHVNAVLDCFYFNIANDLVSYSPAELCY